MLNNAFTALFDTHKEVNLWAAKETSDAQFSLIKRRAG